MMYCSGVAATEGSRTMTGSSRTGDSPTNASRTSTFSAPIFCNAAINCALPSELQSNSSSSRPVGASPKRNASSCKPPKSRQIMPGWGDVSTRLSFPINTDRTRLEQGVLHHVPDKTSVGTLFPRVRARLGSHRRCRCEISNPKEKNQRKSKKQKHRTLRVEGSEIEG